MAIKTVPRERGQLRSNALFGRVRIHRHRIFCFKTKIDLFFGSRFRLLSAVFILYPFSDVNLFCVFHEGNGSFCGLMMEMMYTRRSFATPFFLFLLKQKHSRSSRTLNGLMSLSFVWHLGSIVWAVENWRGLSMGLLWDFMSIMKHTRLGTILGKDDIHDILGEFYECRAGDLTICVRMCFIYR